MTQCPHCGSRDTEVAAEQDGNWEIKYSCNFCMRDFLEIESERKHGQGEVVI